MPEIQNRKLKIQNPKMKTPDPSTYELNRQLKACQSKSRRNGKVARLPLALRECQRTLHLPARPVNRISGR